MAPVGIRSAALGALLVVLSACVDSDVVAPDLDLAAPSMAILDGSTGGSGDFFFLPPLVGGTPHLPGVFNPNLLPAVRVCELDGLLGTCTSTPPVVTFPPGSVTVQGGQYTVSWDTDGPTTGQIDPDRFYRLEVLVASSVVGWIELDPQDPDGPGQSEFDAYAFRLGETIPVKFWLSTETLCTGESFVTECITGAVIDEAGGNLALDGEGDRLGVIIFEGGLPGENHPPTTVTVERIDADLFLAATGTECIPLFDAPQFGDCFRITTDPVLTDPLDVPALVSICIDPQVLEGIDLSLEQQNQLTMVRYDNDEWEALPDVAGDCPSVSAGLMRVPDRGLMRYAALAVNAAAAFVTPQPLLARDIKFGGFSSSFSRFRYALPGQMVAVEGDGTVLQESDDAEVSTVVRVVDHEGLPVEDAVVHFETEDGVVSTDDAVSDVDGLASVVWTVDRATPGAKSLIATGLGLLADAVPEHATNYFFTVESLELTASVVGPPSSLVQAPTGTIDGIAGESAGNLTITAVDAAGNPVAGADVIWSGDGTVVGGTETGADGSAIGEWILPELAGDNEITATVGSQTATFSAIAAAGPAVEPTYSLPPSSGTAGLLLSEPLVVTVADQFGNARSGDAVSWTVTAGDGSLSSESTVTGADGTSSVAWTLGTVVGVNTVTVEVGGFASTFTVESTAGVAVQPVATGSGQDGVVGTALAEPLSVTVTDQFGNPRSGDVVTWSGDGVLSANSTPTDASGRAQVQWTLGTVAGPQTAAADLAGFSVDFAATAAPGDAASLSPTGSGVSAPIGSDVPLAILVRDEFGNARAGDAVVWAVTGGGGSIVGSSATGPDGSAAASWTLGTLPGANAARVSVGALQADFTADGVCVDGYGSAQVDGTFGAGEWACASSMTFAANISGGTTPAEVYWMNDGSTLHLAVRVWQSAMARVNSLRFDFDNDGDGVTGVGDDVIGLDADGAVFFDESLDEGCVNRNQSGCSVAGEPVDGAGAVANDGSWTVFELSHPLKSGDPADFSLGTGDQAGFFLTLRVGNGAQGNTQFPGFRQYAFFTIVGF